MYKDLKYTIFYYPGTGGHIISWLLTLAHQPAFLSDALHCFPSLLETNASKWRNYERLVFSPICKTVWLSIDNNSELKFRYDLSKIKKIMHMASKHTSTIVPTMSSKARIRACYTKKSRPFYYSTCTTSLIKNEKSLYLENLRRIVSDSNHTFDYNKILDSTESCVSEIRKITGKVSDASYESIDKLLTRYREITPTRLLNIVDCENKKIPA